MAPESTLKTFYSVLILAFFCALFVAGAAVGLRPFQEQNKIEDQKKNILLAANLYDPSQSIDTLFSSIETRLVDLQTGEFVPKETLSPEKYDQLSAPMSKKYGHSLNKDEDIAGLGHLEKYSLVYLAKKDGKIDQIILPVRGKGLWSTMYGYLALSADLETINGIAFYQHGETPGLGGEIENPHWRSLWHGKKLFDAQGKEALVVSKKQGNTAPDYYIDGLSGATLTTNGVNNLMDFWFGTEGFKPFFDRLRKNGGING